MKRIFMLLGIAGSSLAANAASAGEVDFNISLGHSPAYVEAAPYYSPPHYAPMYQPAYQAEVHYPPAYAPAHVIVSPQHEYRPRWNDHGSRGYGGGGHYSRGGNH